MLENHAGQSDSVAAVGSIDGNCSGFIIDTGGDDAAPAHVVTNAHCLDEPLSSLSRTAVSGEGEDLGVRVFRARDFVDQDAIQLDIDRVVYASLKNTDIAVLELGVTLGSVRASGLTPLRVAASVPAPGTSTDIVGVPRIGVASEAQFLRRSTCDAEGSANLLEGDLYFPRFVRNHCGFIRGGSSGSPMMTADHEVFALVNTAAEVRSVECGLSNPCEITASGAEYDEGAVYGPSIVGLRQCFEEGVFRLGGACPLAAPQPLATAVVYEGGNREVHLPEVAGFVRKKRGPLATTSCDREENYGEPTAYAAGASQREPNWEGRMPEVQCVWFGATAEGPWDAAQDAEWIVRPRDPLSQITVP